MLGGALKIRVHHFCSFKKSPVSYKKSPISYEKGPTIKNQIFQKLDCALEFIEGCLVRWTSNHISPLSYGKSPVSYKKSPVSYGQSPVSYKKSPVSYTKSPVSYKKSPVSYEKSPTPYEKSLTLKCDSPNDGLRVRIYRRLSGDVDIEARWI